jgi:23S rRNA pseudouridine1911/1915/1917 synthase
MVMGTSGSADNASAGVVSQPANHSAGQVHRYVVMPGQSGQRLDHFLHRLMQEVSRSALIQLIRSGDVTVDGSAVKSSYRIKQNEEVVVSIPPPAVTDLTPTELFFEVIHEDSDMLVLSKPPGVVVHPAHGNWENTLVHGLLYYLKELPVIGGEHRPGIVHRLDKDTSGLLLVAKNDKTHASLVASFKERKIQKIYHAVVAGHLLEQSGTLDMPIGRHPVHRKKMAVVEKNSRSAVTNWRVIEEFPAPFSFLELKPETGRTHQLRVHMAAMGHPIAGDRMYGKKYCQYKDLHFSRQCLHASELSFVHPTTGKQAKFRAPLWPDFEEIVNQLRLIK